MQLDDFRSFQAMLLRLHGQGRYREALEIAWEAAVRFPKKEARTAYWAACLLSRLGRTDEAVQVFQDARARGRWWGRPLLLTDPDLEPLWEREDFLSLVDACESEHRLAERAARPTYQVAAPLERVPGRRRPVLLALHGRSGSAEDDAVYWTSALRQGFIVVLPQGTQLSAQGMYAWDDAARAAQEIGEVYARVREGQPVDPDWLVLAGISQGGGLAVEMALKGEPVPCKGFVAVIPAVRAREQYLPCAAAATHRSLQGHFLVGEHDAHRAAAEELVHNLADEGICCKLDVMPGVGHELPGDFRHRLNAVLEGIRGL